MNAIKCKVGTRDFLTRRPGRPRRGFLSRGGLKRHVWFRLLGLEKGIRKECTERGAGDCYRWIRQGNWVPLSNEKWWPIQKKRKQKGGVLQGGYLCLPAGRKQEWD